MQNSDKLRGLIYLIIIISLFATMVHLVSCEYKDFDYTELRQLGKMNTEDELIIELNDEDYLEIDMNEREIEYHHLDETFEFEYIDYEYIYSMGDEEEYENEDYKTKKPTKTPKPTKTK